MQQRITLEADPTPGLLTTTLAHDAVRAVDLAEFRMFPRSRVMPRSALWHLAPGQGCLKHTAV